MRARVWEMRGDLPHFHLDLTTCAWARVPSHLGFRGITIAVKFMCHHYFLKPPPVMWTTTDVHYIILRVRPNRRCAGN